MEHIRHIFFDLDHTLWDFELNSKNTLRELIGLFQEQIQTGLTFDEFFPVYTEINDELWKAFRESRINAAFLRHYRFRQTFSRFGIEDAAWIDEFGHAYMTICPTKPELIPFAKETLKFFHKKYPLHIITNGFSETQKSKLQHSGLKRYFGKVITSEFAQAKKPDPVIFNLAMESTGATPANSLYIGDHYEADVVGGLNAGMNVIFFNPNGLENPLNAPEIQDLRQLQALFS